MSELKPCPFCKSNNTTLDYYEISCPQELGTIVVCNDCGASVKSIVDWNTRPIEDALNARIAELEAENERLSQLLHDEMSQLRAELEKRTAGLHYANAVCMEMKHELDRLNAEIKATDDLLKEATETIGAVIACCTYNSNNDAKIGVYGIDQNAFTRIDKFITHYNDAVSARQVSVDVKTSTDNNKGE